MKIIFNDMAEFILSVIDGDISFSDKNSTRLLVNSICEQLTGEDPLTDLHGQSQSEALDRIIMNLECFYDMDWYTVVTFGFDIEKLTQAILNAEEYNLYYTHDDLLVLVDEFLSNWTANTTSYLHEKLSQLN